MSFSRAPGADLDAPQEMPLPFRILGAAGMMPLLAAAVAVWTPGSPVPYPHVFFAGLAYAAVALSFLGGLRWGMEAKAFRGFTGIFTGIVPVFCGWTALIVPPLIGLFLLIAGFFLQAFGTVSAAERGALPLWSGTFVSLFTSGAVIALLAMLFRLVI